MKYAEQKFLIHDFRAIAQKLDERKLAKHKETVSLHYYAQQKGNDVLKIVQQDNSFEIHELSEEDGKFYMTRNIPVESLAEGLSKLKQKGVKSVGKVKMACTDYDYKDGVIGLYVINDFLHSLILSVSDEDMARLKIDLGLENAEGTDVPYNKYLEKINKLEQLPL